MVDLNHLRKVEARRSEDNDDNMEDVFVPTAPNVVANDNQHLSPYQVVRPIFHPLMRGPQAGRKYGDVCDAILVKDEQSHVYIGSSSTQQFMVAFVTRFNNLRDHDCITANLKHSGCGCLAYGPNDTVIAAFDNGNVELFDRDLNKVHEQTVRGHEDYVTAVDSFEHSRNHAVSCSVDGE